MFYSFPPQSLWIALCAILPFASVTAYAQDTPTPSAAWPAPTLQTRGVPKVSPQPLVMEVVVDSEHVGKQHVVFVLPPDYESTKVRYPAVLTFAGLGESKRGNRAGAWGWVEKYGVVEAMSALHRGPLTREVFQGLVSSEELQDANEALKATSYRGVVLVCPYPPQRTSRAYERFLIEELIPYTKRALRVGQTPEKWGIDGISMGGMLSTRIGIKHHTHFRSLGSQQSSFSTSTAGLKAMFGEDLEALRTKRINIATSQRDPFKPKLMKLSKSFRELEIPHRFTVLRGRHDKRFVQGPGSLELLLFHDRALWNTGRMPEAVPTR